MSNAISRQEPIRKAIDTKVKPFSSIPILTVKTADNSWVLYAPIVDIIGERSAMGSLYNKRVPILVNVGGKDELMEFVSRADFLSSAINDERHKVFRDFVINLLEQLEDHGFVVSPSHQGHPLVKLATETLEAMIKIAELERQTEETRQRQTVIEGRVDVVESVASKAAEDANRAMRTVTCEADWFPLVNWAETQGIYMCGQADGREEGIFLADVCRKKGVYPKKIRTTMYPRGVNIYPLNALLWWKENYLGRNPELRSRLRGK